MDFFNLNDKKFIVANNENGLSADDTVFEYTQVDNIITGNYSGGTILKGQIIGKQTEAKRVEFLFQCITDSNELKTGQSVGMISKGENNKLLIHFDWQWLNGDLSGGESVHVEI